MEVTNRDKCSSFLCYIINYDRKKFYDIGPFGLFNNDYSKYVVQLCNQNDMYLNANFQII